MSSSTLPDKGKLDYRELLKPFLRNWKWFVVAIVVAIIVAVLKIRYTIPEYAVQAKIQILQDQSTAPELSAFQDLGMIAGSNTEVEDEIQILTSRSNLIEVVQQLGLNVKIMALGTVIDSEQYISPPFKVNFLIPDSLASLAKDEFYIKIISATSFSYADEKKCN